MVENFLGKSPCYLCEVFFFWGGGGGQIMVSFVYMMQVGKCQVDGEDHVRISTWAGG